MIAEIIAAIAAHYSIKGLDAAVEAILRKRPDLAAAAVKADETQDPAAAQEVLRGSINAAARDGSIIIDGAMLQALGEIRIDHENGNILIGGTTIIAKKIEMGGRQSGKWRDRHPRSISPENSGRRLRFRGEGCLHYAHRQC